MGVKRLTVIVLYSVQEHKWVVGNCKGNLMKCVGEGGVEGEPIKDWHSVEGKN